MKEVVAYLLAVMLEARRKDFGRFPTAYRGSFCYLAAPDGVSGA